MPDASRPRALAGRRVRLPGHFAGEVTVEDARPLGAGAELRVRLPDGALDEAVLSADDLAPLLAAEPAAPAEHPPVDPEQVRLLVESTRIRLAWAWDRQFAVSLSGIRTLPHQIEAVYRKMLPQPRLRFLLADDPGAGKTIMAGLLVKELKLRQAIDRCLVLVPAPLTLQWQDELLRFFGEPFQGAVPQVPGSARHGRARQAASRAGGPPCGASSARRSAAGGRDGARAAVQRAGRSAVPRDGTGAAARRSRAPRTGDRRRTGADRSWFPPRPRWPAAWGA